ncbi:MAG: protease complex subunit PrcB family protein [Minisyncoccia bacterium]
MKDTLIIGTLCALAVIAGAWLYFSEAGGPISPEAAYGPVAFTPLLKGEDVSAITERKNFRLKSREELEQFWRMLYANGGPLIPSVNFDTHEVLAIFDGSHSSGGYEVSLVSIEDSETLRTVVIRHSIPGDSCVTASAIMSPFLIVQVPRSGLPIKRIDEDEVRECE